jgi:hypothetical protein
MDATAIDASSSASAVKRKKKIEMLEKWHSCKDVDKFMISYPIARHHVSNNTMDKCREWLDSIKINAVPKLFINGYPLPEYYNIHDLRRFLFLLIDYFKAHP